jgi:hypothetical protein
LPVRRCRSRRLVHVDRGSRRLPVRGAAERVVFNGRDDTGRGKNEFVGNDFREADLDDVAFRDIDLDAQLLPQGAEYIRLRGFQGRVKAVRKEVKTWPQEAARADAEEMLRLIESVYEDEPDVFTKRSFLIEMADSPEVSKRVLEIVERSSLLRRAHLEGAQLRRGDDREARIGGRFRQAQVVAGELGNDLVE